MKRAIISLIVLIFCLPVALGALQDSPTPRAEITSVNATGLPEVLITANVFDPINQPLLGLTAADFELVGDLAGSARIVDVQNISDDELTFSVVLVIDISSSMEGLPIDRAIEAAQLFVESIGPNDSVAVYTFSDEFELVQPFSTDKDALRAAIAGIGVGGPTGLYQAAYNTVGLAAGAPNTRRAVVLLSDGAEYGGASSVGRGAALEEAQLLGVPVYTIGLGYGIDRTYLRELAEGTNAQFFESPDPEQLTQIYTDLATLLQSQYVITLNVDVPADGTEYALAIEATTPFGSASDDATLRAPIPVPIVTAPAFDAPLLEPTDISPEFAADDEVVSATFSIDGGEVSEAEDQPFRYTIDPVELLPGTHTIEITITDVDGDTGRVTGSFEVGTLPPEIGVVSNLDQTVENVQTVQVNVGGQTPGTSATFQVDDGRVMTDAEAPFAFDIDPLVLSPGAHTLTIEAGNEGGASASVEVPFTVANLEPYVVIVGLEEGDVVTEPVVVEVDVIVTQTPVTSVEMLVNGQPLDNREIPPDAIILSTATLDPLAFAPGPATLTVRVTNSSGGVSESEVSFTIGSLPPVVVFGNLSDGDILSEDQDAAIDFLSQTPISSVDYTLDGEALPQQTSAPWNIPLAVLDLGPGAHTLTITANSANGETTTASVEFTVSEAPGLTATALVPTATPTATIDVPATLTVEAVATERAASTVAANTQVAQDATATERSFAATGTAEFRATGTVAAAAEIAAQATAATATQAAIQATRTEVAAATSQARSLAQASTATSVAGARATQTATEATATTAARQTATAQSAATAAAESAAATATEQSNILATQTATEATATTAAQATATARAEQQASATADAEERASATVQAQVRQQATSTAQSAATVAAQSDAATATEQSNILATQTATEATATTAAQATATARAEQQASATAVVEERASATAQARQQATSTARSAATATRNAQLELPQTAAADALATETHESALIATTTRQAVEVALAATSTRNALDQARTETAEARQATATAQASATLAAEASATQAARDRLLTQTAVAEEAIATETAQVAQVTRVAQLAATATQDAAERADALTATASSRQTATAQALAATATQNAEVTSTAQTRLNVQSTADAGATESASATAGAATASARETNQAAQVATNNAQATADTRATVSASVTEEPTQVPPTEEPTVPATPTPRGTLVPVEAESQTADVNQLVPVLVVIVAALIVLVVIYLILRGGRGRR